MASEAEASCESDPNFAIICAFLEKFGELCGIGSVDFVELQSMLENNQEVSPELMNLHIKLLRKTKKNVTVERWERALVNMCHSYSSKDAWEIERFGYKKTRLQIKLRALKELLEMQFDYNTKFKNEVNKMTAESLRAQPLGRDKSGRAYWFQTDNNYQIRIYKEDPDEETWHLVAKDREGLLSLMNELADGDSKFSSDSALNEDSNSLSEKPFIDTGQSRDQELVEKSETDSISNSDLVVTENQKKSEKEETADKLEIKDMESKDEEQKIEKKSSEDEGEEKIEKESLDEDEETEETQNVDSEETKRPMLRIKSLSELMETPRETKKAKLDSSQITEKPGEIEVSQDKKSPEEDNIVVSEEIEEPVMHVSGSGSGEDCEAGKEIIVSEEVEEEVMFVFGEGAGRECETGNEIIVSEEIEEEVMFIIGEGSGEDCMTGNEKEQTTTQQTENTDSDAKLNVGDSPNKVPIDKVNLDTIKDSKTDNDAETNRREENVSPKKTQFFFGPGSLNIKPCPVSPVISTNQEATEEIGGKNGSISEENTEEKREDKEVNIEENPSTEDKVPLSECSLPQDPEKKEEKVVENDPGKEEIEEEIPIEEPVNTENEAKTENVNTKIENEEKCEEDNPQKDESPQAEESSLKNENLEENQAPQTEKPEEEVSSEKKEEIVEVEKKENETQLEGEKLQGNEGDSTKIEDEVKKDEETSEDRNDDKISESAIGSSENAKNEEIEGTTSSKQEDKTEDTEETKEDRDGTEEREDGESDKAEEEVEAVKSPEIEDEAKEEATASKRKRVTRNTNVSNESITEEDMNPRKKVPVEKTKKKAIKQKIEEEEQPESSSNETRPTRQTRQTRSSGVPVVQTVAIKGKGKAKKAASKSDEAESPAPLESVTVIDTDNSNTGGDNTEKDPLAVSEEDLAPTVPSITSFSFDYDPNSPAPEESAKRGVRKRGRDNSEDKPEVPDKEVKRPKMRGKRTVDQSLRKSVEEKRQMVGEGSSDENEPKKEAKGKGGKKTGGKKKAETPSDSDNASQKSEVKAKRGTAKNTRILKNLGVKEEDVSSLADSPAPVRQSRRIAQIKIKEEATRRRVDEDDVSSKKKKKKSDDKDFKVGKRKRIEEEVKPVPTPPMVEKKRKRKTKQNKISIGWKSSSEDSDNSCQEEEEVSEYEEHHEEEPLQFKSDHEFSPESDLECDEPLPLKRARTVRKEESYDDDEEPEEEFPCQKCGKSDHPEWILLCDKCDNGWHCSCLRPALFVIPEGDWYCPTCQHETLLENLNKKLIEFDKMMVKKEMEDRRKERLAYVGISLNNVLPAKEKKEKKADKSDDSEESSKENTPSASEDSEESDSDEPIYQLRQRRQAHSYKFQDYDDLINSALQEEPPPEVEKTHTLGRGKDIATIVNAAKEEEEKNGFEDLPPVVPRDPEESRKKAISYRKKPKRLNNLEVNSDDEADDSDEDFKGSSSEESDEEDYTEDSDDSYVGRKSSRPVRRSTRARTTRYDADFIDDDSDEAPSRKKKKKRYFSDSESSLSDDWRGKKKKSSKKSKKKKMFDDSDLENYRKKKPKIKYGMDSEDDVRKRRTRGKKTSYLDTLGSDSEDETLKKKIRDKSDDEYVAEEDEEKESEEEGVKPSGDEDDDDEDLAKPKKNKSEESDSEDEALVVKKVKLKTKRAIMDSEEEEDEEKEVEAEKTAELPKVLDKNQVINEELAKTVREFEEQVPKELLQIEPKQPEETQRRAAVPGLNVEKLKACGITVTKVAKDRAGEENKTTPDKLTEIGNPPVNLAKIDKSLEELDEDEVEEMMENEEYANRQLELAAIQIREAKRMKELEKRETIPKKQSTGRFFNAKPSPEPMLGNSSSILMNDDDNDELSEPPGVTLPLFSELGAMKVHNLSKTNNRGVLNDAPPPPISPNRAVPVPLHNMGMVPPNPFGSPRIPGMMHHMRLNRPLGPRGGGMPPMMVPMEAPMRLNAPPGNIPNVPRNVSAGNSVPMGSSPNLPTGLNMTMASSLGVGANAAAPNAGPGHGANVAATFNESPDGTPKKRRGRGKGKKTLAAEAAAAAAAASGLPEANKIGNNAKPPAANIEIASPPQPFSQSQPAPSVITRMLQTTPGKGAFPVGRIRPKQFAMMQDSDDSQSPRPAETQEKDMPPTHPAPTSHPPVSAPHGGHPPGHYGPPPGQYPPNYYPKDDQPQPPHPYHHQRPPPPPMHPYPPHPSQPPMDAPPLHQPPISHADSQYPAPPPPSKPPYDSLPPHRPPYPGANAGYNYDYNVPPPVLPDEGVPPAYENPPVYPEQYETGASNIDPSGKGVEEEPSGEFGGLVSYFSSQHEDELEQ